MLNIDDEEEASPTAAKVAKEPSHAKLSVRELKELLTAAGFSYEGATEKNELVRLLTKARAQASAAKDQFVALANWQRVPDGIALPPGLEVKFDLRHGCNYARLMPSKVPKAAPPPPPPPEEDGPVKVP